MVKNILSVNGSRSMNFLLQTVFEKECRFVPVNDVFQGMHYLRVNKKNTNVLIVDMDFQTQHCWELIQHLKSSKLYRIPVVVLTTINDDVLKQKCYEYEVDEIFVKPFNPEDLVTAVKCLMTVPVPAIQ